MTDVLSSLSGRASDEQLIRIEELVGEAADARVLDPLPTSDEEFNVASMDTGQLGVLRDRLYRLGYLRSSSDPSHASLRRAIERFQTEAGITVDGWVGAQSWDALQELFAFEPPTQLSRWLDGDEMTDALRRAVCLRLQAFEFLVWEGDYRASLDEDLTPGLHGFASVLGLLGVKLDLSRTPVPVELLSWLFDFDALGKLLAQEHERVFRILHQQHPHTQGWFELFVRSSIKIELWLLGYEQVGPTIRVKQVRRNTAFARANKQFWKDQGLHTSYPKTHGKFSRMKLFARTIKGLARLNHDGAEDGHVASSTVIGVLDNAQVQREVERGWARLQVGAWVWDGVRRIGRFLRSALRKLVSAGRRVIEITKDYLSRIVRFVYEIASGGAALVGRGIKVFSDSIQFLFGEEVSGSSAAIAMRHDRDFDFKVFVNRRATRSAVEAFLIGLGEILRHFRIATRLLGSVLRIVLGAMQLPAGPWAWWRFLKSLIEVTEEFKDSETQNIFIAA